jgi:leucyl/phenylalanyl-tRNA---protein transferase
MTILAFPPVELADEDGLLAVGGDLEVDSLLLAYRSGIFPWPLDERCLTWFAPPQRTLLFLKDAHISKKLLREFKSGVYRFEADRDFERIISACAELTNRGRQRGTWITPSMRDAYTDLHKAGFCHCIGCYQNDELIGGLYGVALGGMFSGESMFFRKSNASKLALCCLIEHLRQMQCEWIDCQVMTPLLKSFGAVEVPRETFMRLLAKALTKEAQLFPGRCTEAK